MCFVVHHPFPPLWKIIMSLRSATTAGICDEVEQLRFHDRI